MGRIKRHAHGETTVHRNGDVSYYNPSARRWDREPAANVPNNVIATLEETERATIMRAARKQGREYDWECAG